MTFTAMQDMYNKDTQAGSGEFTFLHSVNAQGIADKEFDVTGSCMGTSSLHL